MKKALKAFFVRVTHVFTRVEAAAKTAAVTVIGGGVTAVTAELHNSGHMFTSVEQLLALKVHFISGAVVAFFMYLSNFPKFQQSQQQSLPFSNTTTASK